MIDNPFAVLERRLNRLEFLLLEIKELKENPPTVKEKLLNLEQAAEFLNLAQTTIYSLVSKNEIPVHKKARRLYFTEQELVDWLKEGRPKAEENKPAVTTSGLRSSRQRKGGAK